MFKVQQRMCATCIYRPESPLDLRRLVRDALKKDSWRVCCRGFWEAHRNDFNLGRIAQRLGAVKFVDVDERKEDR